MQGEGRTAHLVKNELVAFSRTTLEAAQDITRTMFGHDCSRLLQLILSNPVGHRAGCAAGELVVQDDAVVGFQAAIVRQLSFRGKAFCGIVGSTLCMKSDASPVLLMQLMKATIAPRGGSRMFYGNTANPQSMKMNRLLKVKGAGPESCCRTRFAVLNVGSFVRIATRGRLPKALAALGDAMCRPFAFIRCQCRAERVTEIGAGFDAFWRRYLAGQAGLVSSRTSEELRWMFGEGLASGRNVLLARRAGGEIVGYVVLLAADGERTRWRIADWIALNDDRAVLDGLLRDAVAFLRRQPHAAMLESIGFNMSVQNILSRHLRFSRKNPNNSFIYQITDSELAAELRPDFERDWFWGPYDGDRCMG